MMGDYDYTTFHPSETTVQSVVLGVVLFPFRALLWVVKMFFEGVFALFGLFFSGGNGGATTEDEGYDPGPYPPY